MHKSDKRSIKPLAGAICLALGSSLLYSAAYAGEYTFTFGSGDSNDPRYNDGLFTMLDPSGIELMNVSYPYYGDITWGYGRRTQISGSLTINTDTLSGTGTILPFEFFSGGPAFINNITLSNAGIDPNTGHQLILGKMQYEWHGNISPLEIVWDASGLFNAIASGVSTGDVITNGAIPASENIRKGLFPIGPAPIATTTWNTSSNGTLPLTNDGIGGSPTREGPFLGFNLNLDITRLTVGSGVEFLNVNINSTEGSSPECTGYSGGTVNYTVTITGDNNDPVTNVEWSVDGNMVASGITAEFTVPFGSHTVSASVSTEGGRTATDFENIQVSDRIKPVISAKLVNIKTGQQVTEVESGSPVEIQMEATDTCDPNPTISGTGGFSVEPNDRFTATRNKYSSSGVTVSTQSDNINFTIVAKDSSGNTSIENLSLNVKDKAPAHNKANIW
ncbi:MAG: hypothetical protein OEY66_12505 [Gammaproteobacteria bacterium]|nr:hypothetical protein [Gammaproteobacteria bacterium]